MAEVKILIVEDELLLAEDLKQKLERLNYEVIGMSTSGEDALSLVGRQVPDIAILDINLDGEMNGLEIGAYLKRTWDLQIIYLTQFNDINTFEKAKASRPSSYLTKPVNIWDLVRAIELSMENNSIAQHKEENQSSYFLRKALYLRNGDQRFERVDTEEILFLKASGAYTEVHTLKKKFVFSENLSHFERVLRISHLVRVHRSWMVNVDKVDVIDEQMLFVGKEKIPVGKTYRKVIKQFFKMI